MNWIIIFTLVNKKPKTIDSQTLCKQAKTIYNLLENTRLKFNDNLVGKPQNCGRGSPLQVHYCV